MDDNRVESISIDKVYSIFNIFILIDYERLNLPK